MTCKTWRAALLAAICAQPISAFAQSDAAPSADNGDGLNEIIVTARRANERLQDVPIAITAADSATLTQARVFNVENLQAVTPSIRFTSSNNVGGSSNLLIRGIGTTGNSRAFEGAVGLFIDGVYRSRSGQAMADFLDVESLQILRGPQGTLFGKNTTAGALLMTSIKPNPSNVEGSYLVAMGDHGARTVKTAINLPLGDDAAIRLAGSFRDRDAFVKDPNSGIGYDNVRARSIKGQLFYEPSNDFSARLIVDYSYQGGNCCVAAVYTVEGPTQAIVDSIMAAKGLQRPSSNPDDYETVLNTRPRRSTQDMGATLHLDLATGLGDLKSITAYRRFANDQPDLDLDYTGADIFTVSDDFRINFFSQELSLSGDVGASGKTNYLFGVFYSDERLKLDRSASWGADGQAYYDRIFANQAPGYVSAPVGIREIQKMSGHNASISAFTQWNIGLTDTLAFTAGGRFSHEYKQGDFRFTYFRPEANAVQRVQGNGPAPAYDANVKNNAVSGTASLQYRPTQDIMGYLSFSRGFKAGGVALDSNAAGGRSKNPDEVAGAVPGDPTYKPEYINTYEAGMKIDFLDRRARANFAFFYNDISELQVSQFTGLQFTILNAATAKVYGAEFEGYIRPIPELTMNFSATYLPRARYGVSAAIGSLSERRMTQAPKLALNGSIMFDKDINDSLAFTARAQASYASDTFISTTDRYVQKAYALMSMNVGLKSLRNGWTLEGYVDNLFDKRYLTVNFSRPSQSGSQSGYVGAPRTFGVTLRGDF